MATGLQAACNWQHLATSGNNEEEEACDGDAVEINYATISFFPGSSHALMSSFVTLEQQAN